MIRGKILGLFLFLMMLSFVSGDVYSCVDLEEEKNPFVTGTLEWEVLDPNATLSKIVKRDVCFNETALYEVYCDGIFITQELYICPRTAVCKEGACSKCNPIGFRIDEEYCSEEGIFKLQKARDAEGNWEKCNDHYECLSNVCIENQCVHPSFIRRVIEWIKNFLGGNST